MHDRQGHNQESKVFYQKMKADYRLAISDRDMQVLEHAPPNMSMMVLFEQAASGHAGVLQLLSQACEVAADAMARRSRCGPMDTDAAEDKKLKELKPASRAFEDTTPREQTLSFRLGPAVPKGLLRSRPKGSHALEGFPFALAPVPKSKPLSFLGFAPEMRTKRPPTDEPDNARATKTAKSE